MDDFTSQVVKADERARAGRAARLKLLQSILLVEEYPAPALAYEFFEEARLCWYVGAFVATILMVQLAFEELLRSRYRTARGVGGKLDSGVPVDDAGFAQLIEQGKNDHSLSSPEAGQLRALKDCRNLWVHAKDEGKKRATKNRATWFDQLGKMVVPDLVGIGVEDEAQKAITFLTVSFPLLCKRQFFSE